MRRWVNWNRLAQRIGQALTQETNKWLFGVALAAIALTEVLANWLYDIAHWGGQAGIAVLAIALVGIMGFLLIGYLRDINLPPPEIVESTPPPHKGLVWILSEVIETPLMAIKHHARGETLQSVWVLYTQGDEKMEKAYQTLINVVCDADVISPEKLVPYPLPPDQETNKANAQTISRALQDILAHLPAEWRPADVIVDITGGTRPMAAGAIMTCAQSGVQLEYIDSDRVDGKFVNQRLIRVRWEK